MKRTAWFAALALLPAMAMAQGARLKLPDFSGLAGKAKESVDISLDGDTLKMAGGFLGGGQRAPVRVVPRDHVMKGGDPGGVEAPGVDGEVDIGEMDQVQLPRPAPRQRSRWCSRPASVVANDQDRRPARSCAASPASPG